MIRSVAILRARPGREGAIREALVDLAEILETSEPGTAGFEVVADAADPAVFALLGRFADVAALEAHDNSDAMTRFLWAARDMLDGPMTRSHGVVAAGFNRTV